MPQKKRQIPVIDLFAGPGGLGEGFSSLFRNSRRLFDIKLSIEKDENAHRTLELRSFYRQFNPDKVPKDYYSLLKSKSLKEREVLKDKLFTNYSDEAKIAEKEAWHAELGGDNFPNNKVDSRISQALNGSKEWVLIGGPPCQAYSLVGRSRVGGIDEQDHRVFLYQEYLRIIAKHHPSIFVMENVKGLLSAKIEDKKIFPKILEDLRRPSQIFPDLNSPDYQIYSLVKEEVKDGRDYLIKSEKYGVPQKRHRVILLGVRSDIVNKPKTLVPWKEFTSLESVIGKLPKVRSGLNRRFVRSEVLKSGKIRRVYEKVIDSNENWEETINSFKSEAFYKYSGLNGEFKLLKSPIDDMGAEYVKCPKSISKDHVLKDWYLDKRLDGVSNHQSRSHLIQDLKRYLFASSFALEYNSFPRMADYHNEVFNLLPDHKNVNSGKFTDRFRVQMPDIPATTITSHISKDGHYFIHYDPEQCRSLTVREAARVQTFPDNYLFMGSRTQQFHQVGNAVPPYLAKQIAEIVEQLLS